MTERFSHPIDAFYDFAGVALRGEMSVTDAGAQCICAVCERPIRETREPGAKVVFEAYGIAENHCVGCHSLFQGSIESLGVERYSGANPVPAKLGMLTGCAALLGPGIRQLLLNPGFFDKLGATPNPAFDLRQCQGNQAIWHVLENTPTTPFVFIENFGRRKKDLVDHLRLSNGHQLALCSPDRVVRIPIAVTRDLVIASAALKKAEQKKLKNQLKALFTGTSDPADESVTAYWRALADKHPTLWASIQRLPGDPHACLKITELIGQYEDL